jgi:cobalt-zinc-cadmium efflux system membrane fusion protein
MSNKTMRAVFTILLVALMVVGVALAIKSTNDARVVGAGAQGEHAKAEEPPAAEFERGPHRGRMLRDGDFALEITIFEEGVPPEFHVYPYNAGKPIPPSDVKLAIELGRLGNRVDKISFTAEDDFLKGDQVVVEPHSFDVTLRAERAGKTSEWSYESYEGRTQISPRSADAAGVKVEKAGPTSIKDVSELSGVISLNEDRNARIGGRFAGYIRSVNKTVGQSVSAGELLAKLDRNVTLQDYDVVSPIDGVVVARNANIGSATTPEMVLFEVADLSTVWAELHVFGRDRERVKVGQPVVVESDDKLTRAEGTIAYVMPVAEAASQAVVVRVVLDNKDSNWFPGTFVRGLVTVSERKVPLAVKNSGLQRFRDFTVVFAQVGDTYEVRMLDLGASDGTWTEVLGGLEPGQDYVAGNSFLIKADIEKSGATHDH